MYQKITLVLCALFVAGMSFAQDKDGCLVYRSPKTEAIAAYAFDKSGTILESVRIDKEGRILLLRSEETRGSVIRQCRPAMENILGRADSERLRRVLGRDELSIEDGE